jgi:hypothetical protein
LPIIDQVPAISTARPEFFLHEIPSGWCEFLNEDAADASVGFSLVMTAGTVVLLPRVPGGAPLCIQPLGGSLRSGVTGPVKGRAASSGCYPLTGPASRHPCRHGIDGHLWLERDPYDSWARHSASDVHTSQPMGQAAELGFEPLQISLPVGYGYFIVSPLPSHVCEHG